MMELANILGVYTPIYPPQTHGSLAILAIIGSSLLDRATTLSIRKVTIDI